MRTTTRTALPAALALCLTATLLVGGCATNPATGKSQLSLIGEAQEIEMGKQADKEIVGAMGLYDDPELQTYVQELGSRLAATSERPNLPWTFRVIDDPMVNAFALPGGFIYVTRGIMAHLNSEAELVAVLGHEIGHVTAKHSVNQMSKAQLATIGLGVGMVLSPEFAQFGDLAQTGLGLMFLKFSRDDERQADELGLRYSLRSNYDARYMPAVFTLLKRVSEASGGGRVPGWLATHPDPANRAEGIQAQLAAVDHDFSGAAVNREGYFRRLDGMVFGPNPREGFFEESAFLHPELAFRLDFPAGWQTRNQKQSVVAVSQEQDAIVELAQSPEADPQTAASKFLSQEGLTGGRVETGQVNGLPAAAGGFEATVNQTPLAGRVLFVRYGESTYRLLGYTKKDKWSTYAGVFDASLKSFRRLTDPKALAVQPARLEVHRPRQAMTLEQFQQQFPSTVPLETLGLINHVEAGGTLGGGLEVKRVIGGPGQ